MQPPSCLVDSSLVAECTPCAWQACLCLLWAVPRLLPLLLPLLMLVPFSQTTQWKKTPSQQQQ